MPSKIFVVTLEDDLGPGKIKVRADRLNADGDWLRFSSGFWFWDHQVAIFNRKIVRGVVESDGNQK